MIKIIRTDSGNLDFAELIKYLDSDLAKRDGNEHSFYDQFNKIDKIKNAIVAYENGKPVGCGAMKEFSTAVMEFKRMYTVTGRRGKGIASAILIELEKWATELSYTK